MRPAVDKRVRRYHLTFVRKQWELFKGYGGSVQFLIRRAWRDYPLAAKIEPRWTPTHFRIVVYLPWALPIRGCGNDRAQPTGATLRRR